MAQLDATMTVEEWGGWLAYHQLVAEERQKAAEKAEREAKSKIRR